MIDFVMRRTLVSSVLAFTTVMTLASSATAVAGGLAGGVAVFQGRAIVGDPIDAFSDCAKSEGLNFPVVEDPDDGLPTTGTAKTRCWAFEADRLCVAVAATFGGAPILDLGCNLFADGNLTGFCGMSSGSAGAGEIWIDGFVVSLHSMAWPLSAGGIVPVNGVWGAGGKGGVFAALLQTAGSIRNDGTQLFTACLRPNGATTFEVNGVAALLPAG